jgi:hypothetical protein
MGNWLVSDQRCSIVVLCYASSLLLRPSMICLCVRLSSSRNVRIDCLSSLLISTHRFCPIVRSTMSVANQSMFCFVDRSGDPQRRFPSLFDLNLVAALYLYEDVFQSDVPQGTMRIKTFLNHAEVNCLLCLCYQFLLFNLTVITCVVAVDHVVKCLVVAES